MRRVKEQVDEKGDVGKGRRREAGVSVPFYLSPVFSENKKSK